MSAVQASEVHGLSAAVGKFVVIAPETGEPAPPAGGFRERRALQRRVRDAAVPDMLVALSWAAVPVMPALVSMSFTDPSWLKTAWAITVLALFVAGGAAARRLRRQPKQAMGRRRVRSMLAGMAGIGVAALSVGPWIAKGDPVLCAVSYAVVGMGLATLWAALPAAAAAAAVLPLTTVAGQGAGVGLQEFFGAVLASMAAAVLAVWRHRAWFAAQRQRLEREEQMRILEAQRDEAMRADQEKSRFLAIASHDLRQPVHALGLFAATLDKRLKNTSEEPLLRNVMHAIDGLERSFNAMLDISRLDAGTIAPNVQHFPVRDLFRRLHMHFAGQAEVAGLGLRFSPGGKSISSDPQLLERIVGNLVQNALKYTTQGAIVVVARSTQSHVNIEVWDTGIGIGAAELPRIFDEFYQVGPGPRIRTQGLGIGLAIVKRLAALLDHPLSVSSRPGRGTMFRVGIPRGMMPEIRDVTAAADTIPMQVLQLRSVLVIDDEAAIVEGLRLLLDEWGYQVITAASAREAALAVRALDVSPDLILSDLHLGDGPDGIEAINGVRRQCAVEVPAILITGDTTVEELRRAADSGHLVLFKPLQARKLFDALRGMVS